MTNSLPFIYIGLIIIGIYQIIRWIQIEQVIRRQREEGDELRVKYARENEYTAEETMDALDALHRAADIPLLSPKQRRKDLARLKKLLGEKP